MKPSLRPQRTPGTWQAWLLALAVAATAAGAPVFRWTTLAGRASIGSEDGAAAQARFSGPQGLAIDAQGNVYVADAGNATIRRITAAGVVSTLAGSPGQWGSTDGVGSAARFAGPEGVAVDATGNVYVADTGNHTIRRITPAGEVTTIAGAAGQEGSTDGAAGEARFSYPRSVAVDRAGKVYVGDHGLRRIAGGKVETILVEGGVTPISSNLSLTMLARPDLAVDPSDRVVFTGDVTGTKSANAVLALDAAGKLSVLFRNGYGTNEGATQQENFYWASIARFGALSVDAAGNVFVFSFGYFGYPACWVAKISPLRAVLGTYEFRSTGGSGMNGNSTLPTGGRGVAVDLGGNAYVTRYLGYPRVEDGVVLRIGTDGATTVLAGTPRSGAGNDGTGEAVRFAELGHLFADKSGNVWATDKWGGQGDSTWIVDTALSLRKVTPAGVATTPIPAAIHQDLVEQSRGLAVDEAGNVHLGFALSSYDYYLRKMDAAGTVAPWDYLGSSATDLGNFVIDGRGNQVFAGGVRHSLRQRSPDGTWSVLAGAEDQSGTADGSAGAARFNDVLSITKDRQGNYFVLDFGPSAAGQPSSHYDNCRIRRISPTGAVTTVSGNLFLDSIAPTGLAVGGDGTFFLTYGEGSFLAQLGGTGELIVIGGRMGREGSKDGAGAEAEFIAPRGIVADAQDNLYLIDGDGATIRKGWFAGLSPTISLQPQSQSAVTGQSVQFSVGATASPAPTYQWFFNGSAIVGATGSTLSIASVQAGNGGDYWVEVANSLGRITSDKALLSVGAAPAPSTGGGGGGALDGWLVLLLLALRMAVSALARSR